MAKNSWTVAKDSVSPMDGTRTIEIEDQAVNSLTDQFGRPVRPILELHCEQGDFSAMFYAGVLPEAHDMLGTSYGAVDVRFKFDSDAPIQEGWPVTNNPRWLVTQRGYSELVPERLLQAKTLMVEFTMFESGKQIVRFNLTGLDKYVGKIRASCPDADKKEDVEQ